jgi:hypothetical protein
MTDNKRAADDAEREAVNRWSIEQKVFLTPDQWDALWIALSSRADGGKDSSDARDAALKEAIKAIQDEITWRNGHGEYEYEKGLWAAIDELEELAKEPK